MASIYVGNLPFSATERDLIELFTGHGHVSSVTLVTDRETGRPRGFGFVELELDDAGPVISALNGTDMQGRILRVNHASSPRPGGPAS